MRNYCIVALISMWFFAIFAYSPTVIHNKKFTNADGKDVCLYDNIEIELRATVDQQGKCRELYCDDEFKVVISTCFDESSDRCHYEGANLSLPFSNCCGIRVCS